ncbi:lysophospholipid acyltransferase family protein [Methylothermus subterraneus]
MQRASKLVVWLKVFVKGAAVLAWLLGGTGLLTAVFPWLKRLSPAACDAIRVKWFQGLAKTLRLCVAVRGAPLEGAALIVSNHVSWLDVVVLGTQAPFTFVAKREVADWPLIGWLARASGTLFVARGNLRAAADLVHAIGLRLHAGERVAVFPEGTTTPGQTVLPFARAVFQAAGGLPIQPVALRYLGHTARLAPFLGEETFIAHLVRVLAAERVEVKLVWLLPLPACSQREVLAQRARTAILACLRAEKDLDRPAYLSAHAYPKMRQP